MESTGHVVMNSPVVKSKEDAWEAQKIDSNSGARNSSEYSPPIHGLDNPNKVKKNIYMLVLREHKC